MRTQEQEKMMVEILSEEALERAFRDYLEYKPNGSYRAFSRDFVND